MPLCSTSMRMSCCPLGYDGRLADLKCGGGGEVHASSPSMAEDMIGKDEGKGLGEGQHFREALSQSPP